ncbi:MAG: hypothetical protein IKR74_00500 [Bacilli bacterium]|nr:hypothetical protein [Bacilli bacterium]
MKKFFLLLFILFFVTGCVRTKYSNINIIDSDGKIFLPILKFKEKNFEFGMNYKLSEIFKNNKIVFKDEYLDVSKLGENTMNVEYILNGNTHNEQITYNVVDTTKPLIYNSGVYTMYLNDEDDLVNRIICADNQDANPNCFIEGEYDLTTIGSYPLKYVAIDNQGNKNEAEFTLVVKKERPITNGNISNGTTYLENIIEKYKTNKTRIGIDVSKYQGDINWQDVKNAGIEFAMIRLGFGYGEVLKMDDKYLQNIKGALENNIDVGIYFYSYATTMEEIELQSNYVLENIKDYNITFPIVYDWENFKDWNEYGISLYDLRHQQEMFLKPFKEKGYQVLQYGSKNYLRNFWEPIKEDIWLAFYIREGQTLDFEKPIKMWQICNNGKVPGIDYDVDIDIYYK